MGKSFWPFLVRCQADVARVKRIMDIHNARQDVGDKLESGYMVKYKGHTFWLLKNVGGERLTTFFLDAYIKRNEPEMFVFWPFAGPPGWFDIPDNDVFYDDVQSRLDRLPAEAPALAHPFTRTSPPAVNPRDAYYTASSTTLSLDLVPRNKLQGPLEAAACHACGKITSSRCAGCKSAFSCTKKCQVDDWPLHKVNCKRVAEAGAMVKAHEEEKKKGKMAIWTRVDAQGNIIMADPSFL